jgi:hypothetical protein
MATAPTIPVEPSPTVPLFTLSWETHDWSLSIHASALLLIGIALLIVVWLIYRWLAGGISFKIFELDQAEIGVGSGKFRFKPNMADRQIGYAIWVELSTRKIGLPIDFDHDVISEIYDSWHTYFSVTRELVKGVPVSQVKRDSTQKIIRLSIEVLNEGLRPHLTHWQARFRHWYDRRLKQYDADEGDKVLDPQQIQSQFPRYEELKTDMERVNQSLIRYRRKMHELVLKD